MTPQELLLKAAEIVERPNGWTQGAYARDADGQMVWSGSEEATCHCAMGAIWRVAGGKMFVPQMISASEMLEAEVGHVPTWNDRPDQTEANVAATMRKVAA